MLVVFWGLGKEEKENNKDNRLIATCTANVTHAQASKRVYDARERARASTGKSEERKSEEKRTHEGKAREREAAS